MQLRTKNQNKPKSAGLFSLVLEYKGLISILTFFGLIYGALNLVIPLIVSRAIDSYSAGSFDFEKTIFQFLAVIIAIFIFTYAQWIIRAYGAEKVVFDLRKKLSTKISRQPYRFIDRMGPDTLLTNLTSDADIIKRFVSIVVSTIVRALFLVIGSAVLMLMINWKLALAVLVIIPIIAGTFTFVFLKLRALFKRSREIIDWLNAVIRENIFGAPLVRVLHSEKSERTKFEEASGASRDIGIREVHLFSIILPVITIVASLANVIVLLLGGHLIIGGQMSLGDFAAFNSYIAILVFPIIMIGFMSNLIARTSVSFERIQNVLNKPDVKLGGEKQASLTGNIMAEKINRAVGGTKILNNISFSIPGGSKTAIIGPTAAGKTQLLYILIGLTAPDSGSVSLDGTSIDEYDITSLYKQIGFVFQDSVIFNLSIRGNVAFNDTDVTDEELEKALETAELGEFIKNLPEGVDTSVSERGLNLSGGQKQRLTLARALAQGPRILILDDFTARVDPRTEEKILANIARNYPDLTIISVTQKISAIRDFDKIILIEEAEKLAEGTHDELLEHSPEYAQLFNSQKSADTA